MTTPHSSAKSDGMLRGIGLGLLGFALFSMHDATVKSLGDISVFQIVFFTMLFSFVPFAVYIAVDKQERSLRPRLPGLVALRCIFTLVGLNSAFYAFSSLPMAEVYALLFSAPILITLLAIPILGERIKFIRWLAIVLGLVGVVIVLRPIDLPVPGATGSDLSANGETADARLGLGHVAALVAALCVACASVVTRKIGAREHSLTLVLYPMLTNITVTGIALIFVYQPMAGETLLRLAIIGLLSVVANLLMISAYRTTEAQYIAPMQYSQMIWALFYGVLVFDEPIDQMVLMGGMIIVLSGLLFIWRELVASVKRPVLSTRNMRHSGGPQANPVESDKDNSA